MDWNSATLWWVAAGLLVAAELATGTFYLLMLALGAAAAAVSAHAGLGLGGQLLTAAVVGGGATAVWHRRRSTRGTSPGAQADRNVVLDVGERVHVDTWSPDGEARVHYRGAAWQARWDGAGPPSPGAHVIRSIDGNRLVLDRPGDR